MNWDAIGAIGEIIGAAAVVAALMYLSIQTRQANLLARASAVLHIRRLPGCAGQADRLIRQLQIDRAIPCSGRGFDQCVASIG